MSIVLIIYILLLYNKLELELEHLLVVFHIIRALNNEYFLPKGCILNIIEIFIYSVESKLAC